MLDNPVSLNHVWSMPDQSVSKKKNPRTRKRAKNKYGSSEDIENIKESQDIINISFL